MGTRYSVMIARRFESDRKLSIPAITSKEEYFLWTLKKLPEEYQRWEELWDRIEKDFRGSPEGFLDYFYSSRDLLLKTIQESDSYQRFRGISLEKYQIPKIQPPHKNLWAQDLIGKKFIHFDLKAANFQALKEAGVIEGDIPDWSSWVTKILGREDPYFSSSKYIRQVVFGALGAPRQITIEKYLIWTVMRDLGIDPEEVVYFGNDDFAIEDHGQSLPLYGGPLEVRIDRFTLEGWSYRIGGRDNVFYKVGQGGYKCIPGFLWNLIDCSLRGVTPEEMDRMFVTSDILCEFKEIGELIKLW